MQRKINQKGVINFKEIKETYMRRFQGKKGKGEMKLYCYLKKKNKVKKKSDTLKYISKRMQSKQGQIFMY